MAFSSPAALSLFSSSSSSFSPAITSISKIAPLLHARSPAHPCHQRYYLCLPPTSVSYQYTSEAPPPGGAAAFDLRGYWSDLIPQINAELEAALPRRYPERIHDAMRYSVLSPGAKRAPPVMCIAVACELLGVPRAAALPTACALEMVHAASLIHDDLPCMDAAPLRRGRLTNHAVCGVGMAVLAGDALFPQGFRHIVSRTPPAVVPEDRLLLVVEEIARAVGSTGMAAGQYLDLGSTRAADFDVMTVLEKKFGEMAECSAACGGLLGGAGAADLEALRRYGRAVGLLYQVVDDILMEDADGSAGEGKMRSKASVVRVYGMERAMEIAEELRAKAKRELQALQGNYGLERVLPLHSFVDYAVERGFDVVGGEDGDAMQAAASIGNSGSAS